ncbi:MAG: hypothetical protein JWO49_2246 [Arthrobacter sp.]|nr:hypothetical protein [Arthrobacter sp.]MCU1548108.1 hypothetical protein [Arthrobacter sp.]
MSIMFGGLEKGVTNMGSMVPLMIGPSRQTRPGVSGQPRIHRYSATPRHPSMPPAEDRHPLRESRDARPGWPPLALGCADGASSGDCGVPPVAMHGAAAPQPAGLSA